MARSRLYQCIIKFVEYYRAVLYFFMRSSDVSSVHAETFICFRVVYVIMMFVQVVSLFRLDQKQSDVY